ncbi:hypothetical protein [Nodosilinea sp. P-1105]|uniref:hypothetical protein n=1 Tax=Nodosilinea sp. P-1105 TaxID=2546229 RepID=UPI00146A1730|nr:hypothetical protein [Nodosilinea sp. P-1105]NMF85117.1 hypothetical protein [Nodosilinea sp. P-1105]
MALRHSQRLAVMVLLAGMLGIAPRPVAATDANTPRVAAANPDATGNINDQFAQVATMIPDFGGFFFDRRGNLQVYLLDPEPGRGREVQAALTRIFGDDLFTRGTVDRRAAEQGTPQRSRVQLRQADYTIEQLLTWFREIEPVLDLEGVWFIDLDEQRNRLTVGIDRSTSEREIQALLQDRLRVPVEAVNIKPTEPIRLASHTLTSPRLRPTQGGIRVRSQAGTCTFGFNANRAGVRGFLTNSHCTATQGQMTGTNFFNHTTTTNNLLGSETVDPTYWACGGFLGFGQRSCRWSDSAFVRYNQGVTSDLGQIVRTTSWAAPGQGQGSLTINHNNASMRIANTVSFPIGGEMVDKMGQTTGWTYGFVNRTCMTANVSTEWTVDGRPIRFQCQDRANYFGDSGDSGSPVFVWYGNTVHLMGIHWGGSSSHSMFSALWNIQADLGNITTR